MAFRGFPPALYSEAGVITRIGHNRFLPDPIKFIIHHHSIIRLYILMAPSNELSIAMNIGLT
jgi:hypothetical protein